MNYMQQKEEGRGGLTRDRLSAIKGVGGGGKLQIQPLYCMTDCVEKKFK